MRPQHLLEQIAVRKVALDVTDEGLDRERPAALEDEAVGRRVVGRERRDADASDAGHGLGKAGVEQAGAQMGGKRRRLRERHGRAEPAARVIDRPGRRRRQPEAREQGVEDQLVVGEPPPVERIALPDDPVLDRPAEEGALGGQAEATVVVQLEGVVLVGPELAGAEAQPPDVAELRPGALAVRARRPAAGSLGRLNSASRLTCLMTSTAAAMAAALPRARTLDIAQRR